MDNSEHHEDYTTQKAPKFTICPANTLPCGGHPCIAAFAFMIIHSQRRDRKEGLVIFSIVEKLLEIGLGAL